MNAIDCDCPYCTIPTACPLCRADLSGGVRRFSVAGATLGPLVALLWECPTCADRWHCWPEGSYYRGLAERYLPTKEQR